MADDNDNKVRVVDFDMPFWSMVGFMLKWAIATIPAMLLLLVFGVVVFGVLGGLAGMNAPL